MKMSILGRGQGGHEGDTRDEENSRQTAEEETSQGIKGESYSRGGSYYYQKLNE